MHIKLGTWQIMALHPTLMVYPSDESLNDILQSCEIDLLLRYFDSDGITVKITYCDSRFFVHVTHQDLVKQFNDGMKQLDVNKLLQISMDGPSVNHNFLEKVSKERKGDEQHQLINIGSCGIHTIHGAFKTCAENPKWNIKQILKSTFQVFHDSPARRDDFESHRNKSLSTLLSGHHVGTAFEARKTIYATCTYQLMEV